MKCELIIFDWDGTLMDSTQKICVCMQQTAAMLGYKVPTDEEVKQIIGISLNPAISILFSITDEHETAKFADVYRQRFREADKQPCELFPGALDMLTSLANANIRLGVATGKARVGLERAWSQTQTKRFFSASRCADEAHSKPHPQMLEDILTELSVNPEHALMIGDTSFDLKMANEAGIRPIGVSYGAHPLRQLQPHDPIHIAHDIQTLSDYIHALI